VCAAPWGYTQGPGIADERADGRGDRDAETFGDSNTHADPDSNAYADTADAHRRLRLVGIHGSFP